MEQAVVAAPGAELSLQLLHLHGRGHGVVRDGRGEPAVGDAEEAEAVGLQVGAVAGQRAQQRSRLWSRRPQAPAVVPDMVTAHTRR